MGGSSREKRAGLQVLKEKTVGHPCQPDIEGMEEALYTSLLPEPLPRNWGGFTLYALSCCNILTAPRYLHLPFLV